MPHAGTALPQCLAQRLTQSALTLPDTDWHLQRLYHFAEQQGLYMLKPKYSRYLIDLNRDKTGTALYANAANTDLCPTTQFDFQPIYLPDMAPDADEIKQRIEHYWQPYHDCLADTLKAIVLQFGIALLFDAHSIASKVPRFFSGSLPDINFGSNAGKSCDASLSEHLLAAVKPFSEYTHVLNGRFKGGYITRHYGQPANHIHAVQLELSQATYMDESYPFSFNVKKSAKIQAALKAIINCLCLWVAKGQ